MFLGSASPRRSHDKWESSSSACRKVCSGDVEERLGPGDASVSPIAPGRTMKPKMKRKSFANVWDAIEDDPTVAANLTMRSHLLIALQQRIESWQTSGSA